MQGVRSVLNWIVQINFGLKLKFKRKIKWPNVLPQYMCEIVANTTLYAVHCAKQVSSNEVVSVGESADMARIKPLKLSAEDGSSKS